MKPRVTLTTFLLARIAEREAAITYAYEHGMPFPVLSPAEMLAECEAKRRVIACTQEVVTHDGSDVACAIASDLLTAVAAVYADHPDYREEWRP